MSRGSRPHLGKWFNAASIPAARGSTSAVRSPRRGSASTLITADRKEKYSFSRGIRSWWRMLALGVLIGMGAGRLDAQVFTPTYMSPQRYDEIGIYLNDGPGNFSVEGLWRRTLGDFDLGFRAAIVARRGSLLLLGAEFRTPYPIPDVPLQTAFTGGVQGVIGSEGGAGFQAGMTTGFPIVLPDFTFVPYIHPRLALRSGIGRDGLELDPLADVGFDFVIPQDLIIRFAIGLGRGTADWGLGVSWR